MPPEVAFTFGLILGAGALLLIQAYGRRKVRQAIAAPDLDARRNIQLLDSESERHAGMIDRLQERIAIIERIATDPAERTSREIDALR